MRLPLIAFTALIFCSCDTQQTQTKHPMIGAWLAHDGTIFNFRDDGTFHGIDLRKKEIWGNWVTLSKSRIGFQSLLHDSYYHPQYAIIQESNPDAMDYIVTGGTHFISASRIDPAKAAAAIELVVTPRLHLPTKSEAASQD